MSEGLATRLFDLFDKSVTANREPFDRPDLLRPNLGSRTRGWAHYGVMIPDLPAPDRYFDIMSIVGTPGAKVFDNDQLMHGSPRNTATLVSATATMGHFDAYSIRDECEMADDGSLIRFGTDVTLRNRHPHFRVEADYPDQRFTAELDLTASPTVTWFVLNPIYEHYSLLCRYEGWVSTAGERRDVAGMCTFEYGSSACIFDLADSPRLRRFKVPLDEFTYQIVNLDESTQLLLVRNVMRGLEVQRCAHLRSLDQPGTRTVEAHTIVRPADEPLVTPDGRRMLVPATLEWTLADRGRALGRIEATVDTPWVYGLGAGYVAGYGVAGEVIDPVTGHAFALDEARGYIEWSDARPFERQLADLHATRA